MTAFTIPIPTYQCHKRVQEDSTGDVTPEHLSRAEAQAKSVGPRRVLIGARIDDGEGNILHAVEGLSPEQTVAVNELAQAWGRICAAAVFAGERNKTRLVVPDFNECAEAIEAEAETALHVFVYQNEPADPEEEQVFREQLQAVLDMVQAVSP